MISKLDRKNSLMSLLFVLVLALSVWLMRESLVDQDGVNISRPTTPDAFMVKANYTSFDAQGQWNSRLYSARITHYADQDTSTLEMPQMTSRSYPLTWIVNADHGIAKQGLKIVNLIDHVKIERVHSIKGKTLTVTTTAMTAYPQRKFARTDHPVTIVQPGSTVHSVGLTADMGTGNINLLSEVRGVYGPSVNG